VTWKRRKRRRKKKKWSRNARILVPKEARGTRSSSEGRIRN
jgi:hypothetical protein